MKLSEEQVKKFEKTVISFYPHAFSAGRIRVLNEGAKEIYNSDKKRFVKARV